MSIILGVDPSLTSTGIVFLEDGKITYKKVIKSKPTKTQEEEVLRLLDIAGETHPCSNVDIVVIEGLAFMARNTTALVQLAALNYFIRAEMVKSGTKFIIVAPTSLKKFITGHGNSQKDEIILEVYKKYKLTLTNNNEADALVLAKIGEALLNKTIKLTKPQQEVIELLKKQI